MLMKEIVLAFVESLLYWGLFKESYI